MGNNIKKIEQYIKEAVITEVNYDDLISEIEEVGTVDDFVSMSELKYIGNKYEVDIVDYDTFYASLEGDEDRKTAPPKGRAPFFGFYNMHNKRPTIVIDGENRNGNVNVRMITAFPPHPGLFKEMLEHESVHLGQFSRNKSDKYTLPNPGNREGYFSDKNEIMAFSQSLAKFAFNKNTNKNTLMRIISRHPLWNDIKSNVSEKTLKRYKKYIYLYFTQYTNPTTD